MNNPSKSHLRLKRSDIEELTRRELIQLCEELGSKIVKVEAMLDVANECSINLGYKNYELSSQVCHLNAELSNIKAIYGM